MDKTPNYEIPIPDADADPPRTVSEEFLRLAAAWLIVDALLKAQADGIAGKANTNHTHQINEISGLASALAAKLDANVQFSLDDLSDVDGASSAALNYVLVKGINGIWRASSAIAALGPHQHQRSDIAGLDNYIDGRFSALIGGAPDALNAINELAAAIGNDPNFAVSVSQQVADVKALVPDHFIGFVPAYAGTLSITIGAGAGIFGGKKHVLVAPVSRQLSAVFGTGTGFLDTGVVQASKTYFIYAIRNISSGATDFVASLSATEGGVAVPTGWEILSGSRIGIILTTSSGVIFEFGQSGNDLYMASIGVFGTTVDLMPASLVTLPMCPVGISVEAFLALDCSVSTSSDAVAYFAPAIAPITQIVRTRSFTASQPSATAAIANFEGVRTDNAARVNRYVDIAGSAFVGGYINGWRDYQCRRLWG